MGHYEERKKAHQREQNQYWQALVDQLNAWKDEYHISVTEMAEGLDISRQVLYNFLQNTKDDGSPDLLEKVKSNRAKKIERIDLLNLWAYVTDWDQYKNRRLTDDARKSRQRLLKEGADPLLRAAGYITHKGENNPEIVTDLDSEIQIVIARLSSNWIQSQELRSYVINNILDMIHDIGKIKERQKTDVYNIETHRQYENILEWPNNNNIQPKYKDKSAVNRGYRKAIRKLIERGKTEFLESEIFELYESVLEHYLLDSRFNVKIKIIDFQFKTLSGDDLFTLKGLENGLEEYAKEFNSYSKQAEANLSFNPRIEVELEKEDGFFYPRVTQILIRCGVNRRDFNNDSFYQTGELLLEHISTASHIENMMHALKKGLCYPLMVSGFFVRAAGHKAKSLARVSISLQDFDKKTANGSNSYQGWWVGSNTITAILKAITEAAQRWIYDQPIDEFVFYNACQKISEINRELSNIKAYLYENDSDSLSSRTDIVKNVESVLDRIDINSEEFKGDSLNKHRSILSIQSKTAVLMLIHASLVRGDIETAQKYIEAEDILSISSAFKLIKSSPKSQSIVGLHSIACNARYKFITGDEEFLLGKQWDIYEPYKTSFCIEELKRYTNELGSIDFDAYFCASHFLGIIGQLGLYSNNPNKDDLEIAFSNLLQAAHYSSRVGHYKRSAQWLMNAVRVFCRMGNTENIEKAEALIKIANLYVGRQPKFNVSSGFYRTVESDDWLSVNRYLASGEVKFSKNEFNDSIIEFLNALKIAIRANYGRLIPDCIYNIYRAASQQIEVIDKQHLLTEDEVLKWGHGSWKETVKDLLSTIGFDEPVDFSQHAENFKHASSKIWHIWANAAGRGEHPFESLIRKGYFMNPIRG